MADIKIHQKELIFLREQVKVRFEERAEEISYFTSNKKSYVKLCFVVREEVENYIEQMVISEEEKDEKQPHVSTGLFRKLFYDTLKVEFTIFRQSFLDTCYLFITDGKQERAQFLYKHPNLLEKE